MDTRKVAIFLPSLRGGGAERMMLRLASELSRLYLFVDLILVQKEGPYLLELPANIRVINLESARVLFAIRKLVEYLRAEEPYVLIAALEHINVAAILAKLLSGASTRIIATVHNSRLVNSDNPARLGRRILPWFTRYLYPLADHIVAVSSGVADNLSTTAKLSRSQIQIIYNPVVTDDLSLKASEPVEHSWFDAESTPVVLAVGRLTQQKDFSCLLRAFNLIHSKYDLRLVILGEGEDREQLESLIKDLKLQSLVDMPGFVNNPYAYMSKSAVFVLSSAWEGLPTVLIEAMATGVPVVATDCISGPREILSNGQYGSLVKVGNTEALAEAIEAALVSPISPTHLRRRAMDFSVQHSLSRYLKLIKD